MTVVEVDPWSERETGSALLETIRAHGFTEVRLPGWLDYERVHPVLGRLGVGTCKFIAPDGRVLVLLPDPTLGVLESVVPMLRDGSQARLCYWADAYRVLDGRWVRRAQVGAEVLGPAGRAGQPAGAAGAADGADAEAEAVLLCLAALRAAGCREVRVLLNDVRLAEALCGLLPREASARARRALARGDFVELDQCCAAYPRLAAALRFVGPEDALAGLLAGLADGDGNACGANPPPPPLTPLPALVDGLGRVARRVRGSFPDAEAVIDVSLVREVGYYDGFVFQVIEPGSGMLLAGGGRYDGLIRALGGDGGGVGFACSVAHVAAAARRGETGGRRTAPEAVSPRAAGGTGADAAWRTVG